MNEFTKLKIKGPIGFLRMAKKRGLLKTKKKVARKKT